MPISLRVDDDADLLVATVGPALTDLDFHVALAHAMHVPGFLGGMPVLIDLRGLDPLPSRGTIDDIVRTLRRLPVPTGSRRALLAADDGQFGISRMIEIMAEEGPAVYSVFRSAEEALAWLTASAQCQPEAEPLPPVA